MKVQSETVEQYLARGGKISVVAPKFPKPARWSKYR